MSSLCRAIPKTRGLGAICSQPPGGEIQRSWCKMENLRPLLNNKLSHTHTATTTTTALDCLWLSTQIHHQDRKYMSNYPKFKVARFLRHFQLRGNNSPSMLRIILSGIVDIIATYWPLVHFAVGDILLKGRLVRIFFKTERGKFLSCVMKQTVFHFLWFLTFYSAPIIHIVL